MTRQLLLIFALALSASTGFAQNTSEPPLITVSGQGEVMVPPDEVSFRLRVVTMDRDLPTAQGTTDRTIKTLLALARKYQIPPAQVQTDHISLGQRFSDESITKKPPVFLGYTVTKKVVIVLRDVSKAEDLLADIFKSGVSEIEDVDFRTTQLRKYKDEARAMAIKAAQEKAIAMTREIGQSIGKAYSIIEEGQTRNGLSNISSNAFSVAGSYSNEANTIALGQISITARVIVSFELK